MASAQKLSSEEFASVAWSLIAEPGDEFAGLLRLSLGPDRALRLLIDRVSAGQILARLADTAHFDLAEQRFGKLHKTAEEALERWLPRLNKSQVENALKVASICGAQVITDVSESWPSQLGDLGLASPAALWVRGSLERLTPGIAIVGSRASTSYGNWLTAELAGALAERGFSVVSGGAFGIDAAAHQSANRIGCPNFAIMAGGVDSLYPAGNSEILREVMGTGAVISELPPGSRPTRWRFLQRNRIIAALARVTVVVEAGYRSGAINTANHAVTLGRPLGAVPGQINLSSSDGCHRLIREGKAELIGSVSDLLELAGVSRVDEPGIESLGTLELRVLDALTVRPKSATQLAASAGVTQLELSIALGSLEMAGIASRNAADYWARALTL